MKKAPSNFMLTISLVALAFVSLYLPSKIFKAINTQSRAEPTTIVKRVDRSDEEEERERRRQAEEEEYEFIRNMDECDVKYYVDTYDNLIERWLDCHPFEITTMMDNMEEVDSSAISSMSYSWPRRYLLIFFTSNDYACYLYHEIEEDTYEALINADSIGGYYNQEIKGQFECTKYVLDSASRRWVKEW